MGGTPIFQQTFSVHGGDFAKAGEVSCSMKDILKEIGIPGDIIRRLAIAAYEAEMNVVMYAREADIHMTVTPDNILLIVDDEGQGIENIELAMREGYSTATEEMREMGFGAGMGLPNIKRNADEFRITSVVGQGTRLEIRMKINTSSQLG
jgi:anti-sigma regulatory factor (Ser/Thr protein kinase)